MKSKVSRWVDNTRIIQDSLRLSIRFIKRATPLHFLERLEKAAMPVSPSLYIYIYTRLDSTTCCWTTLGRFFVHDGCCANHQPIVHFLPVFDCVTRFPFTLDGSTLPMDSPAGPDGPKASGAAGLCLKSPRLLVFMILNGDIDTRADGIWPAFSGGPSTRKKKNPSDDGRPVVE